MVNHHVQCDQPRPSDGVGIGTKLQAVRTRLHHWTWPQASGVRRDVTTKLLIKERDDRPPDGWLWGMAAVDVHGGLAARVGVSFLRSRDE